MVTLSDCVFAWMCREFAPRLGICERDIHPDTPIERFLPSDRRRAFWKNTSRDLNLRFPELFTPDHVQRTCRWIALGSFVRSVALGLLFGLKWFALPLAFGAFALSAFVFEIASRPWATEHPEITTFGDLSRWLLARNLKKFRHMFGLKPTHDEIFITIKAMLTEQLGVDPREIKLDSNFVELLGE